VASPIPLKKSAKRSVSNLRHSFTSGFGRKAYGDEQLKNSQIANTKMSAAPRMAGTIDPTDILIEICVSGCSSSWHTFQGLTMDMPTP
jgi:hypothetical protein